MLIDTMPGSLERLDAVIDGVLEQRLQHQRRHQRIGRHVVDVPVDDEAIAQPQLLQLEVLPAQLDLVGERRQLAVVAHQHAEEVGHVLERGFGALRVGAHQREHGVDAVEQEMRPDARLQRLQPRLGDRRRQRPRAQPEVGEQRAAPSAGRAARGAASAARLRQLAAAEQRVDADAGQHGERRGSPRRPASTVSRASHGCSAQSTASISSSCGSATPTMSVHAAGHVAPARIAQQRARRRRGRSPRRRMRRIVPRLRKSGSAGETPFCLIIDRIRRRACKHRAGFSHGGSPYIVEAAALFSASRRQAAQARAISRRFPPGRRSGIRCDGIVLQVREIPMAQPGKPHDASAQGWSGRFAEPVDRARQALHRVRRLRPAAGRGRHRRLARARAGCSPPWASSPRADLAAIERGMATIRGEIERGAFAWSRDLEDVHLNIETRLIALVGDAGKRLHTGALAQRPGRDRRAPVAARRDRRARRARSPRCARAFIDLAEQHAETDHARLHAPAGRAAGHVRPPPARLRGDVRARRRAPGRLPRAASTGCRSAPPRSPAPAFRSTATRRARARLRRHLRELARRGVAIATSRSSSPPRRRSRWCTCRASPRSWSSGCTPRFGFVDARRPLLHRLVDHAAEEEPRRARARARQDRPRRRPPDRPARADEGPAARVQQGQPGRQGAAVRHRRHARGHAARSSPTSSRPASRSTRRAMRAAAREGYATATDLADYLVQQGRAVPRRARGGRARRAARRSARASTSPTCRSRTCKAFAAGDRRRRASRC